MERKDKFDLVNIAAVNSRINASVIASSVSQGKNRIDRIEANKRMS